MEAELAAERKWTRSQRIRTAAEIPVVVDIIDPSDPPTRLEIAPKAMQLQDLGMTYKAIAGALGVSEKTIARAVREARDARGETVSGQEVDSAGGEVV